ncbi:MAG: hypothetical protein GY697_19040 [Desulfobacterales bacterium]|nr:hypothetical protein [Desulfobacterales bacterium]
MYQSINEKAYSLLEQVLVLMEKFGLPLSIAAWITVFLGSIGMGFVLRKYSLHGNRNIALIVGVITLVAHLADYIITLKISPDLSFEANPLWRNIIDAFGLDIAKWYGLTGKILLAILSFEFYAYYLLHRKKLFPDTADNIVSFFCKFGSNKKDKGPNLVTVVNFFSFLFALLGPFYFYIALLNSFTDSPAYFLFPAAPIALIFYLVSLSLVYFFLNYRAFRQALITSITVNKDTE